MEVEQPQQPRPLEPRERPESWRTWPEITLKIYNLPTAVTLAELYGSLARYGNITLLELGGRRQGKSDGFGKVRFEPVPETNFWSSKPHAVKFGSGKNAQVAQTRVQIFLKAHENFPGKVRSPANPEIWLDARLRLRADRLDFGVRLQDTEMIGLRSMTDNIRVEVSLIKKNIIMMFDTPRENRVRKSKEKDDDGYNSYDEDDTIHHHKCTIDFARLTEIYHVDEGAASALIIPLELPPIFWTKKDREKRFNMTAGRNVWNSADLWARRSVVLDDHMLPKQFPVTLLGEYIDPGYINNGRWTTLRLIIQKEGNPVEKVLEALHTHNVTTIAAESFRSAPPRPALLRTLFQNSVVNTDSLASLSLLSLNSSLEAPTLNWEVHYQLEVCISRGIISEYSLTSKFLERLNALDKDRAKWILEYFVDKEIKVWDPMNIFKDEEAAFYFPNPSLPHYCTTIRKVVVTPSTMHFSSPSVESSNRVLRRYSTYQDRFLRVQFTDELYKGKIFSDAGEELFNRIYWTLRNGIKIGNRHYEFLAFGNSQIRESAVYFFCPTDHLSCDQIRDWMGHFTHIKNVAKYAARIGQCFSTTREIRGVTVPKIVPIEDIERNGHCFSDGIGIISKVLAQIVLHEIGQDAVGDPSAFQFRMGGCKGMLAVWDHAKGLEVHIRKSQEKFKAQFNGLEIVKLAQYSVATLNRQTIIILTALGVQEEVFVRLAKRQIRNYQEAMNNRVAAASLLGQYIDENLTSLTIKDLVCWGFMDAEIQEPFVLTILDLWRIWSMKLLKEKARIVIEQSAFLLGCLDETKTLRGHSKATEGKATRDIKDLPQVFLQIPNPNDGQYYCVTGVCAIGRNPSLHPGDIRVVEAVDVPQLRHLKDVVVFPSLGDQDVPSMLSGGDLDGDDFFVIWNPDLIPKKWHHPPMRYMQPKPPVLKRDVKVSDLRTFFVRYMQNDCLAQIAHGHLAHADRSKRGALDPKCLELAELHSKAVDYVKTGDPAKYPDRLRPREWPHFLGNRRSTYHSPTALGKIYDMVQEQPLSPLYKTNFDKRVLSRFTLTDEIIEKVGRVKDQYDTAMRRLMSQRDVRTEFEAWTGFLLTRPRVGSDYKQQETVGRESAALKQRFRELCYKEAGGRDFDQIAPFVAAMYKVTENEVNAALAGEYEDEEHKRQSMPLISFPWIFHWIMGRIATGHIKKPTINPEAQSTTKKSYIIRRTEGDMEGQETHLDDGRVVHRGDLLEVFERPVENEADGVSQSSGSGKIIGGEEVHVEAEESAMDAMDRLMGF
ncbi:RNA-dependent RNA polymerase 1 [Colletotrichum chlorophyti]|uniref:RNA-dependent RNA polymerase n=1 Tax=Colletotrichum chlorophyti TaxID=708187 RepID=A0A1Q8S5B3_9PEZI|nr:RNA-dependent RNA polymerase 1 [Colletotrichum chlorophyti]